MIINGNEIEFYSRFHEETFSFAYIGSDGEMGYKVFTIPGNVKLIDNRTLNNVSAHRVSYVLMKNWEFSKGNEISGIQEFSFTFPELIDWIGLRIVQWTRQGELGATEMPFGTVQIHNGEATRQLYFESTSFNDSVRLEDDRV